MDIAEAQKQIFRNMAAGLYTTEVGQVLESDLESKPPSVSVRLCREIERSNGTRARIDRIDGVPIIFLTAGPWRITYEPERGDYVLLLVSSRSIDAWVEYGDVQAPGNGAMMDINDAFMIGGLDPAPTSMDPAPERGALEIRKKDRSTYLRLDATGMKIRHDDTQLTVDDEKIRVRPGVNPLSTKDVQVYTFDPTQLGPGYISMLTHTHQVTAVGSVTSKPYVTVFEPFTPEQ